MPRRPVPQVEVCRAQTMVMLGCVNPKLNDGCPEAAAHAEMFDADLCWPQDVVVGRGGAVQPGESHGRRSPRGCTGVDGTHPIFNQKVLPILPSRCSSDVRSASVNASTPGAAKPGSLLPQALEQY